MNATTDLQDIEQGLYASRWDDGLLDLFAGLGVLLVGIGWLGPWPALGGVAPALLIPIWPLVRRRFVEPRSGFVAFGPQRGRAERRSLVGLVGLGLGTFAFAVIGYVASRGGDAWLPAVIPALPGVLIGLGGVVVGLTFQLRRMVTYGLLAAAVAGAFTLLGTEPGVYLVVTGALISIAGAARLARFIREHPVPPEPVR